MIIKRHTTIITGDEVGQTFAEASCLDQVHFLEGLGFSVKIMGRSKWPFQCRAIVDELNDNFDKESDAYRNIKNITIPALKDLIEHLEEL